MASSDEPRGAPPSSVTDAVLVPSNEMPKDAKKVEELDFNKFAGRPITVDDLMSGMNNMGFQASSIGEAVRIINDMVSRDSCLLSYFVYYLSISHTRGVHSTLILSCPSPLLPLRIVVLPYNPCPLFIFHISLCFPNPLHYHLPMSSRTPN